tara:strand:+ start:291 stop:668 length:378 start_codon:yes stop_codon:yes gene_type:complete
MTFTRKNLTEIRKVIDKHLLDAGQELGIDFSLGNIRYSDSTFTVKLEANTIGHDPKVKALLEREPDWYNKVVNLSGKGYKIVGWNETARKNKVVLEYNGKNFAAQPSVVRSKMDSIHNLKWKDVS